MDTLINLFWSNYPTAYALAVVAFGAALAWDDYRNFRRYMDEENDR